MYFSAAVGLLRNIRVIRVAYRRPEVCGGVGWGISPQGWLCVVAPRDCAEARSSPRMVPCTSAQLGSIEARLEDLPLLGQPDFVQASLVMFGPNSANYVDSRQIGAMVTKLGSVGRNSANSAD